MASQDDRRAEAKLRELRQTRQTRVDQMLDEEMISLAPGNAAYWIAVVAGSFIANLLLLVLVAR
jgi:hypothetical protein